MRITISLVLFFYVVACIVGGVYIAVRKALERNSRRKKFYVEAKMIVVPLIDCDEFCGVCSEDEFFDSYEHDEHDCWCYKLRDTCTEVEKLVIGNELYGMKEFETYVQDCVDAFYRNCERIHEVRKRQKTRYCANVAELQEKVCELKEKNEMILKEVVEFKKEIKKMVKVNGRRVRTDDIMTEGDAQLANLGACVEIMNRVITEFNAWGEVDDE